MRQRSIDEWPTLLLLVLCYTVWAVALFWLAPVSTLLAIVTLTLANALHSSLTHEAVHGHPTGNPPIDRALVWPALGLLVPFDRFRDTHLAHHEDARLTDPYDDPESNYMDPAVWGGLPGWVRALLRANNTLLGRITLGPAIGQIAFMASDVKAIRRGETNVAAAWRAHLLPMAAVLAVVAVSPLPLWAYLIAVYFGHGLLRVRTFLEHRAHAHCAARTVVIEDRGPLALLFLNNNFHIVHHMHPRVPWFRLPALYRDDSERYLRRNQGYRYRSYAEIFRRHLLNAKDPVPHPLWPQPVAPAPVRSTRPPSAEAPSLPRRPVAHPVAAPAVSGVTSRAAGAARQDLDRDRY